MKPKYIDMVEKYIVGLIAVVAVGLILKLLGMPQFIVGWMCATVFYTIKPHPAKVYYTDLNQTQPRIERLNRAKRNNNES